MSLIVAPEPVAVVSPQIVARTPVPRPDTRPVEASDQANSSTTESRRQSSGAISAEPRAEPSLRPPGKDPSIPPQTIFDASLISADFKPNTDFAPAKESQTANTSVSDGDSDGRQSETTESSAANGNDASGDGTAHPVEAQVAASYSRSAGGSALSLSGTAHPDWLTAVERIA